MREKDIEARFVRRVQRAGGRCYKFVSPGASGVPDRIVVMPGKAPWFAELKSKGGSLSALQRVEIAKLASLGQRVEVIASADEADGVEL